MQCKVVPCALIACALSISSARAENPRVNTQVFRPSPHAYDLFSTATSEHAKAWGWAASLWASYQTNTLVFVDLASDERQEVIADQMSLTLTGGLALTDWLSVGLAVPYFLVNDGDDQGFVPLDPVPSSALGDIRVSAKLGIITRRFAENGIGLAFEVPLTLPTGDADAFVSDGLTVTPTAVLDLRAGPLLVALNLGARIRESQDLALENEVGPELVVRVAAAVDVIEDRLALIGELDTASYDFSNDTSYLEGLLGARLTLDNGLTVTVGGGSGFTEGYGSSELHFVGSVGWATPRTRQPPPPPPDPDRDHDGIRNESDKCPEAPEDLDGFQDEDGCPEPDNDGDRLSDPDDKCPNEPEDVDQFEDEDGCPDPDNDHDLVLDAVDKCPNEAEDDDQFADDDGCPEPDNDGDGILDADDKCPNDRTDRCRVEVNPCEIRILDTVYFEYDKAAIKPESFGILDDVAAVLLTRPTIIKVEVQGHTDNEGEDAYNLTLSQQRADAVRDYLVGKKVQAERLTSVGYGEGKPIASNKNPKGRAANRRVQFIILDPPQTGCAASPK